MKKKSVTAYGPGKDAQNPANMDAVRQRWWKETDFEAVGKKVVSSARKCLEDQEGLQAGHERHYRMYRNMALMQALPQYIVAPVISKLSNAWGVPASLNVVRPMTNTVTSRVTLNRPRAMYSTEGARRATREKARLLEKYGDGQMFEHDGHERCEELAHGTVLFGSGFIYAGIENGKPCVESTFTPEVLVDQLDGMYREPKTMYRLRFRNRDELAEQYEKFASQIADQPSESIDDMRVWWRPENDADDMVMTVEATHIGTFGKKCIALADGTTLYYDDYKDDEHEYLDLRWTPVPHGFYGMGLAEELIGIQIEINRLVRQIQTAIRMLSNPYVLLEKNSGVVPSHIKGIPGTQIGYTGNRPPQVYVPQTVHPEVFNFLNLLYGKAFEVARMNQLMMSGQVPKRFSSGRAQQINMDIQDSGYAWFYRQYERVVMRLYERLIKLGKKTNSKVKVYDREQMSYLDWKTVNPEKDEYVLRPYPTAFLGVTPQAKRDSVDWMMQAGLITDRLAKLEVIDSPDLDKFTRRELGGQRYLEQMFDAMLAGGKYTPPPSEIPLTKAIVLCQDMILEAYYDEVSLEDIQKLQKWASHARRMEADRKKREETMQKLAQQAMAPPAMLPGAAPAAGLPPPADLGAGPAMPAGPEAPPVDPAQVAAALQGGNGAI